MSPPTLRHRVEYVVFRLLRTSITLLPEGLALGLGSVLGWLAGSVLRFRRRDALDNLQRAFPEKEEGWHRRVANASYRHLGRQLIGVLRLSAMGAEEIVARTDHEPIEGLFEAVRAGTGAILITGHYGNWEISGAGVAARGLPVDAVVFRQKNLLVDRELSAIRTRLGMRVFTKQEAPRAVLRALKEGRLAGLVADQNIRRGGVFVEFFGTPAATARGPALFALRAGVPVFVGVAYALPRDSFWSPQRYLMRCRELCPVRTSDLEEDVRRLTAAHTWALEDYIREAPEQYFWMHRRWKTRPAEGERIMRRPAVREEQAPQADV